MGNELAVPKTLQEAILFYANPDYCLELLTELRWPDGVVCPYCTGRAVTFMPSVRRWQCKDKACRKQFSIKVGTVMEDSPIGLDKWLCAIWLITNAKNGISSYEIHRAIGVTQKTAWFLLHRIRLAMHNGTLEKMSGIIQVDETFVGGLEKNKHESKKLKAGRGAVGKATFTQTGLRTSGLCSSGRSREPTSPLTFPTLTPTLMSRLSGLMSARTMTLGGS